MLKYSGTEPSILARKKQVVEPLPDVHHLRPWDSNAAERNFAKSWMKALCGQRKCWAFPEQHEKRAVGCKGCQMHTVKLTTPWWIICLEKCTMKMSTIPSASPRSVTVMMNFQTLATDVQILAGFLYNLHWKSSVCELSRTDSCENNVIINHFYIDTCLNLPPIRRISLFIFISLSLYICIYIHVHISTYIYIYRIYIYIYIYISYTSHRSERPLMGEWFLL